MTAPLVRIPGKVMLSGEYAVLHGGTAALATVERRLTVREGEFSGEPSPVIREALGLQIDETAEHETGRPLASVAVDGAEFRAEDSEGNSRKLGLGSSAAEAVGVIALRYERAGFDWTERREAVAVHAMEAHRRAQQGRGSGADVWACAMGGPITFRVTPSGVESEPIEPLPGAPALALAWTGISADTRALVDIFEGWLGNDPLSDGPLARLVDAADALAPLWFRAPETELFEALDLFVARMEECARAASLPWRSDVHEELERWALEHGGRTKPTGAGGGDLVLLAGDLPWQELKDIPLLQLAGKPEAD